MPKKVQKVEFKHYSAFPIYNKFQFDMKKGIGQIHYRVSKKYQLPRKGKYGYHTSYLANKVHKKCPLLFNNGTSPSL